MKKEPCSCIQLAVRLSIFYPFIHVCMHPSILIHLSTPACIHVSIHSSSIHPCRYVFIHPFICLSIHASIHLVIYSVHSSIQSSLHPSSIHHSSICPSTHSFIHPPTHSCNHPFSPLCWAPASKEGKVYLLPSMVLHFCSWKYRSLHKGSVWSHKLGYARWVMLCLYNPSWLLFSVSIHYGGETSSQSNF